MQLRALGIVLVTAVALSSACGGDPADPDSSSGAPTTHTVSKGGTRHAPQLNSPLQYCTSCHGADLRGTSEAPSCYSCHGQKWS